MTLPNFKLTLRANSSTYKVYTALLSQSGGSNNQTLTSGAVTKGVTYRIDGSNGNFTNVGAPNNNDGTYFVATINETPTSYGTSKLVYNTGAPIVNVLENTIGNIWWAYENIGGYGVNSNGLFTNNKTYTDIKNIFGNQWIKNLWESYEENSFPDFIKIVNYNSIIPEYEDGIDLARIEIRVYI